MAAAKRPERPWLPDIVSGTQFCAVMCLSLCIWLAGNLLCTAKEPAPPSEDNLPPQTWELIWEVGELVLDQHVRPPARQQIIVSAARAMYLAAGQSPPRELASQFSLLTSPEEFRAALNEIWQQLELSPLAEKNGIERLNESIVSLLVQLVDAPATYVSAKEHQVRQQLKENQYVGIGIQLAVDADSDRTVINIPFIGGPAHLAGAREGDLIIEIDAKSAEGMNLEEVVDALRGPKGSAVSVLVRNRHESDTRLLEMVRDVVPLPTVKGRLQHDDQSWEFDLEPSGKLAYLKVDSIVGSTAAELKTLAREIEIQRYEGIWLDMSAVTDADLHHALMFVDALVGQRHFAVVSDRSGRRDLSTRPEHVWVDKPIAVTVPANVSGPVFCALAALQADPRITLVGGPVRSSGLCRQSFELPGKQGALDSLAYAEVRPDQTDAGHGEIRPGVSAWTQPLVLSAQLEVEGNESPQQAAMQWLMRQIASAQSGNG